MVTHARFFRRTAFLKIFPPVAACRFKSPGRSRRFSNAPNPPALPSPALRYDPRPPIAITANIFSLALLIPLAEFASTTGRVGQEIRVSPLETQGFGRFRG